MFATVVDRSILFLEVVVVQTADCVHLDSDDDCVLQVDVDDAARNRAVILPQPSRLDGLDCAGVRLTGHCVQVFRSLVHGADRFWTGHDMRTSGTQVLHQKYGHHDRILHFVVCGGGRQSLGVQTGCIHGHLRVHSQGVGQHAHCGPALHVDLTPDAGLRLVPQLLVHPQQSAVSHCGAGLLLHYDGAARGIQTLEHQLDFRGQQQLHHEGLANLAGRARRAAAPGIVAHHSVFQQSLQQQHSRAQHQFTSKEHRNLQSDRIEGERLLAK
mmetsp:Transcript_111531/g.240375  ORF Transcript_111531/g.240375 Transcript_111531/m.240375 type:complete len:270 (-) Transcript_111531:277-1086(-)